MVLDRESLAPFPSEWVRVRVTLNMRDGLRGWRERNVREALQETH
jgi:hypothetical protein